jgi:outer membrane biosynthesis protein TonB
VIEILLEAERALSLGLLDQAERLYRQASVADPRNSIAVVGLARVALERGDEPGALAEAERALEIDGENEAARRMVDRLREVRRHRASTEPEAAPAPEPQPELTPEPEPVPPPAATIAPKPTPEPEPAPDPDSEPAPEPARRGGIIGWLLRLFGRR